MHSRYKKKFLHSLGAEGWQIRQRCIPCVSLLDTSASPWHKLLFVVQYCLQFFQLPKRSRGAQDRRKVSGLQTCQKIVWPANWFLVSLFLNCYFRPFSNFNASWIQKGFSLKKIRKRDFLAFMWVFLRLWPFRANPSRSAPEPETNHKPKKLMNHCRRRPSHSEKRAPYVSLEEDRIKYIIYFFLNRLWPVMATEVVAVPKPGVDKIDWHRMSVGCRCSRHGILRRTAPLALSNTSSRIIMNLISSSREKLPSRWAISVTLIPWPHPQ